MMVKKHESYLSEKESERNGNNRKKPINRLVLRFLWFYVFFAFFSCGSEKVSENEFQEVYEVELTEQQCINFAEKLHQSFADSNSNYLNSYIAWSVIKEDLCKSELESEIFDTLKKHLNIGHDFIGLTYDNIDVRFITYYQVDEKHFIIFRVFEQPQSISFFEFELSGGAGEIYVNDIYDFNFGRSLRSSLASDLVSYVNCKTHWKECYQDLNNLLMEVDSLMTQGDLKLAYEYLKDNEQGFAKYNDYQTVFDQFVLQLGNGNIWVKREKEKIDAIPMGDRGRWLPMIYFNAMQGNYAEAQIALANLEGEVGEDTYLHFLRGNLYFEMGDYNLAISSFNKALSMKSEIPIIHLGKIYSQIRLNEFTQAVESMLVMDDFYHLDNEQWILELADFGAFVESDEFNKFLERNSN